jgi:16S rRNA (cytidine1402-2'-O)-methyltransferase
MQEEPQSAKLYVVATPIGNLEDLSFRAAKVLSDVDLIAAEDKRRTKILLDHYGITTPLTALHDHNERSEAPQLVTRMQKGKSIALVSDAGTPLLSDPGYRLVKLAIEHEIPVITIPGASAITAALSIAGLATDSFIFEGFLPAKRSARLSRLENLLNERRTLVFFESSHRIVASIDDLASVFGAYRQVAICRELTKRFETVLRGNLASLQNILAEDSDQKKGEFVIVVAGADVDKSVQMSAAIEMGKALQEYLSGSQSARVAARLCDVDRRELYQQLSDDHRDS